MLMLCVQCQGRPGRGTDMGRRTRRLRLGIVDLHLIIASRAFLAFTVALGRRVCYAAREEGLRNGSGSVALYGGVDEPGTRRRATGSARQASPASRRTRAR